MGRSGYTEYYEGNWSQICWRGAVKSAIRGKRGQAFLREMLEALDELPEKRLIADELVTEEGCCALGAVALKRQVDVEGVDPYDRECIAGLFGIAEALAAEIVYENDEQWSRSQTPEDRFERVREWVVEQIRTADQE